MTIEQTIPVPADHRLFFDLPREIPVGVAAKIAVTIPTAFESPVRPANAGLPQAEANTEDNDEGLNLHPTAEQVAAARASIGKVPLQRGCDTLEEALAASDRRLEAAKTDPSVYSLKEFHGLWKDSKVWGHDVDVEAEIRKMRDEWPDYWGDSEQGTNGTT